MRSTGLWLPLISPLTDWLQTFEGGTSLFGHIEGKVYFRGWDGCGSCIQRTLWSKMSLMHRERAILFQSACNCNLSNFLLINPVQGSNISWDEQKINKLKLGYYSNKRVHVFAILKWGDKLLIIYGYLYLWLLIEHFTTLNNWNNQHGQNWCRIDWFLANFPSNVNSGNSPSGRTQRRFRRTFSSRKALSLPMWQGSAVISLQLMSCRWQNISTCN